MRRDEVTDPLSHQAFEFFFRFSRYEAALKEYGYLKSNAPGAKADPNWGCFIKRFESTYVPSKTALRLVDLAPQTQVVEQGGGLGWSPTTAKEGTSNLGLVVLMLKTVRNNLFHGGKKGAGTWDQPERTAELLASSILVLDELAWFAGMQDSYSGYY